MADLNEMLMGASAELDTHADVVFVIDATDSMQPTIDMVKETTLSFFDGLQEALKEFKLKLSVLRVKVIWFRDFYCDGSQAYGESKFFDLPEEKDSFHKFVSEIHAAGGGDLPESSLEALTLAMRSDFDQGGDRRRHIIVLFTDDEAHPFEEYDALVSKAAKYGCTPEMYPDNMPKNLADFCNAWEGNPDAEHLIVNEDGEVKLDRNARRLLLFAPDGYPWSEIGDTIPKTLRHPALKRGMGGAELAANDIYRWIGMSMSSSSGM